MKESKIPVTYHGNAQVRAAVAPGTGMAGAFEMYSSLEKGHSAAEILTGASGIVEEMIEDQPDSADLLNAAYKLLEERLPGLTTNEFGEGVSSALVAMEFEFQDLQRRHNKGELTDPENEQRQVLIEALVLAAQFQTSERNAKSSAA